MANFDPDNSVDALRCVIWRLAIAATRQRRGYGRFAVEAVCAEARRRGQRRVTVTWVPGKHGPEDFYLRLGLRLTGQRLHGEVVGELPRRRGLAPPPNDVPSALVEAQPPMPHEPLSQHGLHKKPHRHRAFERSR